MRSTWAAIVGAGVWSAAVVACARAQVVVETRVQQVVEPNAAEPVVRDPFLFDPEPEDLDEQGGRGGFAAHRFEMNEAQINGWIFQDGMDPAGARKRLEDQLETLVASLSELCGLSAEQEAKLRLAGGGDLERFYDQVEAMRRQHLNKTYDQNEIGQVYQKFQPLAQRYQAGLFGERSLLARTVRRVLRPDQAARYEAMERQRRAYQYRAKAGSVLSMLDRQLGLTDTQYDALESLVVESGAVVRSLGRVEYYAILYRLAQVPEARLKEILDPAQWKLLAIHLQQARSMREMLTQQGYAEEVEEAGTSDAGSESAP